MRPENNGVSAKRSALSRRRFVHDALAAVGGMTLAGVSGSLARNTLAADQLNIQAIWLNDPEFIGYMIAIDNGYYAAEGLNVNYMPGGPDVIPEAALLTGKADISLTNLTGSVKAWEKGAALKIIGTQYQKSPVGVISLAQSNIKAPKDLAGKTVACPPLSIATFHAMLKLAGVPKEKVRVVPFTFDPTPLAKGDVDAAVDFVTELPYLLEQKSGKKSSYFLFWDVGLPLFIDLVTVTADTLKTRRGQLVNFLRASRKGWAENNANPEKYVAKFANTWFKGNGSSIAAENFHNRAQIPLMANPKGLFALSPAAIDASLAALQQVGLKGSKEMFDLTLLAEI
jgi:ABC-type nitrate/sulfonate/bicarbonate transport system substrate-binding protein